MSDARRRRRAAEQEIEQAGVVGATPQTITLQNPVSEHFKTFIVGNICYYQERYDDNPPVVEQGSASGETVVICGAGPSLSPAADEYTRQGSQVWGCNSALQYLHERGHRVTHGFTVDQTPAMVNEWEVLPDVEYLIASSIHPHLLEHLCDSEKTLRFFHNYVGIKERPVEYQGRAMSYEDWMYYSLYPGTMRAGSGLNSVTRAIDVAEFMGFERIVILGADCAINVDEPPPHAQLGSPEHLKWLEEHTTMHADGGSAIRSGATHVTIQGEIDGRLWVTKPDMAISAQCLVQMKRKFGDRLELVGDTFPNAILDKPAEFLSRLPNFVDSDGQVIPLVG